MQSRVISGPRLKCVINGRVFGIVTSFRYEIRSSHAPAQGLDQNTVQEWIPTTYRVSGQVGVLRLHGTGGLEGAGVVAFSDDVLRQKYLTIELVDRVTERTVFSAINSVVSAQSWQVAAKGLLTGSFAFEAENQTNNEAAP